MGNLGAFQDERYGLCRSAYLRPPENRAQGETPCNLSTRGVMRPSLGCRNNQMKTYWEMSYVRQLEKSDPLKQLVALKNPGHGSEIRTQELHLVEKDGNSISGPEESRATSLVS